MSVIKAKVGGIYFIVLTKLEKALEKTFISKALFETVKEKANIIKEAVVQNAKTLKRPRIRE